MVVFRWLLNIKLFASSLPNKKKISTTEEDTVKVNPFQTTYNKFVSMFF